MEDERRISAAVLTVSDSCSSGTAIDKSGPNLKKLLIELKSLSVKEVTERCVADNETAIKTALLHWTDVDNVDLILTTGGTGFSSRDVTPEVTKSIISREAPGLSIGMMTKSLEVTPMAMLSRSVSGIRGKSLIINFPGSVKASQECFSFISPVLPHALDLLRDVKRKVNKVHKALAAEGPTSHKKDTANIVSKHVHICPHKTIKKHDLSKVAERDRHSPYRLVPMTESVSTVLKHAPVLATRIARNLQDALGNILASDIFAKEPYPPFTASIKDGYAVLASDGPGKRRVIGPVTAGDMPELSVTSGNVIRITTGAPLPPGSDAVVQVENTKLVESQDEGRTEVLIEILSTPSPGLDIRPIGFDISTGEKLLSKGDLLGPAELGLLATSGITEVEVYNRPTIAILSTGNEIVDPGDNVNQGQIRDCNRTTLIAACKQQGVHVVDLGIAGDSVGALKDKLMEGLEVADVIVTSGGVSMGEKDLLKPILQDELKATMHFGRVFMKPGKPTTYATLQHKESTKLFFALPGNPVSALVTFYLFVLPALKKMSGNPKTSLPRVKARITTDIHLDPRPEYHRVMLSWQHDDPVPVAISTGSQCSSRLLSMRTANALLVLPPKTDQQHMLSKNSIVDALVIGNL